VSGTENSDDHREFAAAGKPCPLYCFVPWIHRPTPAGDLLAHHCRIWRRSSAVLASDKAFVELRVVRQALEQRETEHWQRQFMQNGHCADD
jgi:hypothetical protein